MLCCAQPTCADLLQLRHQQLVPAHAIHTLWPVYLQTLTSLAECLSCGCHVLQVEIRACTSRDAPIVVDANNVFRQVYVDGHMTWQGTIKFINSFPSIRRAGLWVLISVLSIEDAGRICMNVRHMLLHVVVGSQHAAALLVVHKSVQQG